jgi:hypothetical protein
MGGAIATLLFLGHVSFLLTSPGVRGASTTNAADTASWIAEPRLEVDTDTTSLGRSGKRSCCRTGGFVDPAAAMAGLTSSSVRR